VSATLAAVCCYFNPCGYQKRKRNYNLFRRHVEKSGIPLLTVELLFDPEAVSDVGPHGDVLTLRGGDVLWQKERLLQIGIERMLDQGYPTIAWMDADVFFDRTDWHENVQRTLEIYDCVQMFQTQIARYGGSRRVRPSVVLDRRSSAAGGGWAATAAFWRHSPLYQHCVIGGGDTLMARIYSKLARLPEEITEAHLSSVTMRRLNPVMRQHATNWASTLQRHWRYGYVNIAGVFGFLLRRKPAFAMTGRQVAGARLQLTVCLELKDPACRFRGKAITERRNEAI
jgi:hypothetical protein